MGFFKKKTGELNMYFYDNLSDTLAPTEVSVTYSLETEDVEILFKNFITFLGKVIYCLGENRSAYMLKNVISSCLYSGINKNHHPIDNIFYCTMPYLNAINIYTTVRFTCF